MPLALKTWSYQTRSFDEYIYMYIHTYTCIHIKYMHIYYIYVEIYINESYLHSEVPQVARIDKISQYSYSHDSSEYKVIKLIQFQQTGDCKVLNNSLDPIYGRFLKCSTIWPTSSCLKCLTFPVLEVLSCRNLKNQCAQKHLFYTC